jgi:hypothetical protein
VRQRKEFSQPFLSFPPEFLHIREAFSPAHYRTQSYDYDVFQLVQDLTAFCSPRVLYLFQASF